MIARTSIQPSPNYEFSIRQRAALQLLGKAIEYLASTMLALETAPERNANCQAAHILWQCRELVLLAAERQPGQGGGQ